MSYHFNQPSGYGMFPEVFQGSGRLFRPSIFFNADDGSGAGGGDPAPAPAPTPTPAADSTPPEDVSGLKAALEAERKRNKESDRLLKQLQESVKGMDPEKYKQFEQLQQQAEEWNKQKITIRNEVETEWSTKLQAEMTKTKEFEGKYLDLVKRTEAEKAFQAAKGRSGAGDAGITFFDSLLSVVSKNLRLNDKGQVEVIDANGTRLFSKTDATKPMTPKEYFESLRNDPVLGHCFEPQARGAGGGMPPGSGNGFGNTREDWSKLPRSERLTIARQQAAG